jgi:hypothetical protein
MSIKKKFATAVATASLLAGLFGSAFVPSAMGAIVVGADTVAAGYTTMTSGGGMYRTSATSSVWGFQSENYEDVDVIAGGNGDAWIEFNLFKAKNSALVLTAANNTTVELKALSSNAAVNVGWAYEDDGDSIACNDTSGGVDDVTFGTSSTFKNVDGDGTTNDYRLCIASELETTAATATITITVGGTVAKAVTVTAVGPVTSLVASLNSHKYIAEGNLQIDDYITVVAKDAAGVTVNGADNTVSNESVTLADWADQPENAGETQIAALLDGVGYTDQEDNESFNQYAFAADICNAPDAFGEEGDAGLSYALKFELDADSDVVSNALTITCTGGLDGARVTAVAAEVTSGAELYEGAVDNDIDVIATIVDVDGRPMGDGAGAIDDLDEAVGYDMGISFTGDADLQWDVEGDGDDDTFVIGGTALLGVISPDTDRPGKFTYKITFDDSNLKISEIDGDDAVEKVFTLSYSASYAGDAATITRTRNAAKTVATFKAEFGEDAALVLVEFNVERTDGVVRTYTRRANLDGVATLVLERRNTKVYVHAVWPLEAITDIVAARFR